MMRRVYEIGILRRLFPFSSRIVIHHDVAHPSGYVTRVFINVSLVDRANQHLRCKQSSKLKDAHRGV